MTVATLRLLKEPEGGWVTPVKRRVKEFGIHSAVLDPRLSAVLDLRLFGIQLLALIVAYPRVS